MDYPDIDHLSPSQLFDHLRLLPYQVVEVLCSDYPRIRELFCGPDSPFDIWAYLFSRDITSEDLPDEIGIDYYQKYLEAIRISESQLPNGIYYMGADGFDLLCKEALKRWHLNLFSYKEVFDRAMDIAAYNGRLKFIKLMIENGADDYNTAMASAMEHAHIHVVKFFLDRGATNYDRTMEAAAHGGHINGMRLMLWKGATDYNTAMKAAAEGGHINIVKWMVELGADEFDDALILAAGTDHPDMVEYLISLGANNLDEALQEAIGNSYGNSTSIDIVEYLLQVGANLPQDPDDFNDLIRAAASNDNLELIQLLENWPKSKVKLN